MTKIECLTAGLHNFTAGNTYAVTRETAFNAWVIDDKGCEVRISKTSWLAVHNYIKPEYAAGFTLSASSETKAFTGDTMRNSLAAKGLLTRINFIFMESSQLNVPSLKARVFGIMSYVDNVTVAESTRDTLRAIVRTITGRTSSDIIDKLSKANDALRDAIAIFQQAECSDIEEDADNALREHGISNAVITVRTLYRDFIVQVTCPDSAMYSFIVANDEYTRMTISINIEEYASNRKAAASESAEIKTLIQDLQDDAEHIMLKKDKVRARALIHAHIDFIYGHTIMGRTADTLPLIQLSKMALTHDQIGEIYSILLPLRSLIETY